MKPHGTGKVYVALSFLALFERCENPGNASSSMAPVCPPALSS
jgi:hypothetical protein